eukprot:scaffold40817_cov26-Tisochrysis_lutea.AAC.1
MLMQECTSNALKLKFRPTDCSPKETHIRITCTRAIWHRGNGTGAMARVKWNRDNGARRGTTAPGFYGVGTMV